MTTRPRKEDQDKQHSELSTLMSVCNVLNDCTTPKAKGLTLVDMLKDYPFLEMYVRAVYVADQRILKIDSKALPIELVNLVRRILKGDLQCGLTPKIVNKAFKLCGLEPLTDPEPIEPTETHDFGLRIAFYDFNLQHGYANADLTYNGMSIGTICFKLGKEMHSGLKILKQSGVELKGTYK